MTPMIYATVGAGLLGLATGWVVHDWKTDAAALKTYKAGIARGKEQQELVHLRAGTYEQEKTDAAAASVERQTEIRTIYRTQRVEVPAECEPPASVVRLLEAAVSDANARARGEPVRRLPPATEPADPVPGP